nr:MAG: cell adhesion protein [uncultured archaeon]
MQQHKQKLVLIFSIFILLSLCFLTFAKADYSEDIIIDGIKEQDYELLAENNNFNIYYANSQTKHFLLIESLTYNFNADDISIGFGMVKMDILEMKSKTAFYTMFKNDTILEISIKFSFTDLVSTLFYIEINWQKQISTVLTPKLPPLNPKVTINEGAFTTNLSLVNLTLSVTGADMMCFKNGTDEKWSDWESYTATKLLYLSGIEEKQKYTIYAKFKNENGESVIVSDSIIFSTIPLGEEEKPYFGIGDVLDAFGKFLVENPGWIFLINFFCFLGFTKIYFLWHYPIIHITDTETGKSKEIGRFLDEEPCIDLLAYNIIRFKSSYGGIKEYYSKWTYTELANIQWHSIMGVSSYCCDVIHKCISLKFYLEIPKRERKTGTKENLKYWILFRLPSFLSQSRRCSMWLRDRFLEFVEVKDERGLPEMIKEIDILQPRYCEDKIVTLVDVQYKKWVIKGKGKEEGEIITEEGIPLYQVKKLKNNDLVVKKSVKELKKYDGLEKIESIAESIKYQHSLNEMISIQDIKQSKSEMRIKELSGENFGLREALIQKENEFRKSLADTISQIEKRARADNIDIAKLIEGIVAGKMSSADIRSTIKKEYRDFLEVRSSGEVNNLKIQLASAIRHIEFIEGKLKRSEMKQLPLKAGVSEELVEDNLLEE